MGVTHLPLWRSSYCLNVRVVAMISEAATSFLKAFNRHQRCLTSDKFST